jgi:pimeloyl-ACP methyl ester carboxylesterase
LRGAPVTTVDGRRCTYPEIISDTLARPTSYPQLAQLLQQLHDTGTATPELLNAVTGSEPLPPDTGDEPYLANRADAYTAIQCSDSTVPTDPAVYSRAARDADRSEPDFGRIAVFSTIPCTFWQGHDADRYAGPWNRRTSAPILVLNTSNDPATPLLGAYAGASQLSQALVVVIEGAGHTSMYVASTCAERVKGTTCSPASCPPRVPVAAETVRHLSKRVDGGSADSVRRDHHPTGRKSLRTSPVIAERAAS